MAIFSPIHHFFAPQADSRQFRRALQMLPAFHRYKKGKSLERLEQGLSNFFGAKAFLFCTGTDAMVAVLRTLELSSGDEVVVSGYTCFSPGGAVEAAGGKPVYVEASPDLLTPTPAAVEEALTPRTKAIICQQTFGIPAEIQPLRKLCDDRGILLIEDCAHVIPDDRESSDIAIHGHVTIFSFGRYKPISGMAGGAAVCRVPSLAEKVGLIQATSVSIGRAVIFRLLLFPIIFPLVRPFIGVGLGTFFLWMCRKLHILIIGSTPDELKWRVGYDTYRLPNACAYLALEQWDRIRSINDHRRVLTQHYLQAAQRHGWTVPGAITKNLPLQKFPIFIQGAERIRKTLLEKNIHLYDGCWSRCNLTMNNLVATPYLYANQMESDQGRQIMLLPVHSTMSLKQARQLTDAIAAIEECSTRVVSSYYERPSCPKFNAYAM